MIKSTKTTIVLLAMILICAVLYGFNVTELAQITTLTSGDYFYVGDEGTTDSYIKADDLADAVGGLMTSTGADAIVGSISEGALANSSVVSADIKDGEIAEPDLDFSNSPSDNDMPSYNLSGTNMTWETPTGTGVPVRETSPSITTPTLIGSVDLEDDISLEVDASMSDHGYTGITDTGVVDSGEANEIGHCLYMTGDGEYELADADAVGTVPCVAISTSATEGSAITILTHGKMKCSDCVGWPHVSEAWDEGDFIYVDNTSGYLTDTAPSGSGDYVQKVGRVVEPTPTPVVYFFFSMEMTEIQ